MRLADKVMRITMLDELAKPEASQRGLAARLGVSVSSVNQRVRSLCVSGATEKLGEHRRTRYALTRAGEAQRRQLAYELLLEDTPCYDLVRADLDARVGRLEAQGVRRCLLLGDPPLLELAALALLGRVEILGRIGAPALHLPGVDGVDGLGCDAVVSVTNEVPGELRRAVKRAGVPLVFFT